MEFITTQWMPILVSAVVVFFVSFVTHMVLPLHKGEFKKLPDEDKVMDALSGIAPDLYMVPGCEHAKDMNSPEFLAKMDKGPNGLVVIWPFKVNMGQNLGQTFLFYILVGLFVAYVGWHSMQGETTTYMQRFRICGAVAFAAHGLGWMSFFIWYKYGRFWPNFIDSVAYSLATAGVFAWLWK